MASVAALAQASGGDFDFVTERVRCDARSRNEFVIDYADTPRLGTVRLRQLVRQACGVDTRGYDLEEVRVRAISRNGRGGVDLLVGGHVEDSARPIRGNSRDYDRASRLSLSAFDRIDLERRGRYSDGAWQLEFAGQVKVRRIVVALSRDDDEEPEYPAFETVRCRSHIGGPSGILGAYNTCPVRYGRVIREIETNPLPGSGICARGRTYGLNKNSVWVAAGCSADLTVEIEPHH
jgi:hypothetical protein